MDYELELNDICCESFFNDYFLDRNTEEYREKWVDEDHDSRVDFVNCFMDMVEEEMHLFVQVNLRTGSDLNERLWDLLVEYGMTNAYRLYKETNGEINEDTSDVDIITCILMSHAMDEVPNWMDQMEEAMQELEESDDENDEATWFNTKYPNASCHRCEEKLNGHTVVYCGGHGGACETWYCASCHEDGTDDCGVCKSEEEESESEEEESDDEWENDELVLSLNHDNCQLEGRHPLTSDEDWELCLRGFTEPYTEELYHTLKRRLEEATK